MKPGKEMRGNGTQLNVLCLRGKGGLGEQLGIRLHLQKKKINKAAKIVLSGRWRKNRERLEVKLSLVTFWYSF